MRLRASEINGCAYCIDMHWKDLRAVGETEQRLYGLDAWEESPYYTERERAALAWTEAVTNLSDGRVPDQAYEKVRTVFTEKELSDLTLAIASINAWNRMNIAREPYPERIRRRSGSSSKGRKPIDSPDKRDIGGDVSAVIVEPRSESRREETVFDPNPDLGPDQSRQRGEKDERQGQEDESSGPEHAKHGCVNGMSNQAIRPLSD